MIFRTFPATRTAAAQAAVALLCGAAAHAQTTEAALPAVTISADPAQQSASRASSKKCFANMGFTSKGRKIKI